MLSPWGEGVVYFQVGQQTFADYPAGTAASSPTYNYVYGSYIDEIILRTGSGGNRYYHRNQQYSITALTDGSGGVVERYAYAAYGQPVFLDGSGTAISAAAESNRYTYTGREWDEELHLFHYRARMYDTVSGRFLGRDPIGFEGGVNLFAYVAGSPLVAVDPEGMLYVPPPTIAPAPPQVTIGGGVLIGSIWIGKTISEPFWKWVYQPKPWEPKLGPLPKPVDCPEGFDEDCRDLWIDDTRWCDNNFTGYQNVACHEWAMNEMFKCQRGEPRTPFDPPENGDDDGGFEEE